MKLFEEANYKKFKIRFHEEVGIPYDEWQREAMDLSSGEILELMLDDITVGCSVYDGIMKVFKSNQKG